MFALHVSERTTAAWESSVTFVAMSWTKEGDDNGNRLHFWVRISSNSIGTIGCRLLTFTAFVSKSPLVFRNWLLQLSISLQWFQQVSLLLTRLSLDLSVYGQRSFCFSGSLNWTKHTHDGPLPELTVGGEKVKMRVVLQQLQVDSPCLSSFRSWQPRDAFSSPSCTVNPQKWNNPLTSPPPPPFCQSVKHNSCRMNHVRTFESVHTSFNLFALKMATRFSVLCRVAGDSNVTFTVVLSVVDKTTSERSIL